MPGNTTDGKDTSVNLERWTAIYKKYMSYCKQSAPKSYKFGEIMEMLTKTVHEQLCEDLKAVDDYYMKIATYRIQARLVVKTPTDTNQKDKLKEIERGLCSTVTLQGYLHGAIGALRVLNTTAMTIRDLIIIPSNTSGEAPGSISSTSTSSGKLSDQEVALLKDMLKEIGAISDAVKEEYLAEVGWSPAGSLGFGAAIWDTYVRERRKSLRSNSDIDEYWMK